MNKREFFYHLPEELIAQHPAKKREESRLLVVERETDQVEHRKFYDLLSYLKEGDVLVINDTKVLPFRIYGRRTTGAKVEFLLLEEVEEKVWKALVKPGKKARVGDEFFFHTLLQGKILSVIEDGIRLVKLDYNGNLEEILDEIGEMPLPPYIHERLQEKGRYQTVYAKHSGSAAAPTAGLHFTPKILEDIEKKGISIAKVTLHVGLGTFRPVSVENIEEHLMHKERYYLSEDNAKLIRQGKRVIAVGTTSVRTLESIYEKKGKICQDEGETDIFIYPGYEFKVVQGLVTNFHLPESTLLMLVSAFYKREKVLDLYKLAVKEKYRFFSFGDAMLLL